MYQLKNEYMGNEIVGTVIIRDNNNGSITSFTKDPANTDYANFKREILADKAQLQDADGNLMTPDAAKEYINTLP